MTGTDGQASHTTSGLNRSRLGTFDIVFFVIAAAAPLAVMAGAAPLAFRIGGIGVPGAYVFSGIVYILCAAGLTAFARYVANAGAFYAFVSRGLGTLAGVGAAMVALVSYALICFGFYGFLGSYAHTTVADLTGADLHWAWYSLIGLAVVAFLGHRQIEIGARILGVLMALEVLILVIVSIAVLVTEGTANFSAEPFAPANVLDPSTGAMFVLALGAFIGFESTTIYAEEAKNPERTVPRATYIAVGFLAVFYGFVTWIAVAAFGVDGVTEMSASDAFQAMYFAMADSYLGGWAKTTMDVLIVTSIFAAVLAFHNATSRYIFSLGRDRLLPTSLGEAHQRHGSPHRASALTVLGALLLIIVTVVLKGDPYLTLLLWTNGAGIVGIVALQFVCMLAVLRYFGRDRRGHGVFRVVIAPALGAVGLAVGLYLMLSNVDLLTGRTGWFNVALFCPLLLGGVVAVATAARMRTRDPECYRALGRSTREEATPDSPV